MTISDRSSRSLDIFRNRSAQARSRLPLNDVLPDFWFNLWPGCWS